jgi:hypothetical protein
MYRYVGFGGIWRDFAVLAIAAVAAVGAIGPSAVRGDSAATAAVATTKSLHAAGHRGILSSEQKNGFVPTAAYDWWWHNLVARSEDTGELRSFFFEYYVVNPILMGYEPRVPTEQHPNIVPSYAMIMAGSTDHPPMDALGNFILRRFYGRRDFSASVLRLDVRVGPCAATETRVVGEVTVDEAEAAAQSRYLTNVGTMSWNLTARKITHFDAGYPTDALMRASGAFQMYWHAHGMLTEYSGTIVVGGQRFIVDASSPLGYQDKNWGSEYTNPWVWLSCNWLVDARTGEEYRGSGFVIGGGNPVVAGVSLGHKALAALRWKGTTHAFNFANLLKPGKLEWSSSETADGLGVMWDVLASNDAVAIQVHASENKTGMLRVRYDSPRGGGFKHLDLWNGGHASGTIEIYDKVSGISTKLLVDSCGCEYGAY